MFPAPENEKKGRLEVICGSMFSGKTEELIRRLHRAEFARLKVIVFKHSFDNQRADSAYVISHTGGKISAISGDCSQVLKKLIKDDVQVVGIDEVQFFSLDIIETISALVDAGKRVIVAGLDMDFKGIPFGCMPTLLAIADEVLKLKAICIDCGNDAHYTQRLVNGIPARFDDPLILIGAQESYQARCRNCYSIDKFPPFKPML